MKNVLSVLRLEDKNLAACTGRMRSKHQSFISKRRLTFASATMLALLSFAALLLSAAAEEAVRCPGAFQLVGNTCYKVFRDNASYAEAQVLCRQLDSYLVALESASEIQSLSLFLARVAGDPLVFPADAFWTSGNDLQKDGLWAWRQQKQTLIAQTNWKNGKAPVVSSSQINDKNCVTLQPSAAYEWVAQKCSKAAHFVCETSTLPVEVQAA